ncbi:MAG TPA: hypothetical protein IAC50_03050 [Candidatus Copromorpha excrementigallinarum]|uniref:DUF7479 domain-containing protein n=1 Tax=Candidatus Allocopromorpha excrementigallinarum TaxID=2840742 RepID=A0A9D1L6X9_9FIRM|nr:hypothetical protein [Candidatus Copromorpha excrementigallinarum]
MESNKKLICNKCRCHLEEIETQFTYLDRKFRHKVLRCPECGQVYIPEDLAKGKVAQLEKSLEEK